MAGAFFGDYRGSGLGSTGGYTGQQLGYGTPAPPPPSPLSTQYNLYNQGVKQNAEDYSGIMQGYKDLYNKASSMPNLAAPSGGYKPQTYNFQSMGNPQLYQPATRDYQQSGDVTQAINNLSGLANNGGYSATGIADLRARGLSPIRAIYANAQRNADRQRALSGGYSPNYNAVQSKMARELSDQIGGAVQNVNAGIAQNVAGNRIAAAPAYASASQRANEAEEAQNARNLEQYNQGQQFNIGNFMRANEFNAGGANQANMFNVGQGNQAAQFNAQLPLQYGQYNQGNNNLALQALGGQASLYGTTPALSSLFGNQALQGAQLQNQINQQGNQGNLAAVGYGVRS